MLFLLYPLIMLVTLIVILIDKQRESNTNDSFSNGNLFYRYGRQVVNSTIAIGVDKNVMNTPLINIAEKLISNIEDEIRLQFGNMTGRFDCNVILITDRKMPTDQRKFIKTKIVTKRKSEINYFILVVGAGAQIVIHEYMYLQGRIKWSNMFWFTITSPLHIWFWFYPWILKNHSVLNSLKNSYNKSSYDLIDIITIIRGLSFLFSTKLKAFAKNEGLLTEDLNIVLNQNISNSQSISINNSNKVSLSSISSHINS